MAGWPSVEGHQSNSARMKSPGSTDMLRTKSIFVKAAPCCTVLLMDAHARFWAQRRNVTAMDASLPVSSSNVSFLEACPIRPLSARPESTTFPSSSRAFQTGAVFSLAPISYTKESDIDFHVIRLERPAFLHGDMAVVKRALEFQIA